MISQQVNKFNQEKRRMTENCEKEIILIIPLKIIFYCFEMRPIKLYDLFGCVNLGVRSK